MRFHLQHDPACKEPLNEHTGDEPCFSVVPDIVEIPDEAVAHYMQHPQGHMVADYRADYIARYGSPPANMRWGSDGIKDVRDNRNPLDVARELGVE